MASGVDLHIHTTASDGKFSSEEIVRKAAGFGLGVISICDHDTVDGDAAALEAASAFPKLKVIPGIELSAHLPGSEVHVLGYFVNYNDPEFKATLAGLRHFRQDRAQAMITRLKALGVNIDFKRVKEIAASGSIGRPHIAQAMLEKGYISSVKEAFTRYIGLGGPAYVERHKLTPQEAVELITKVNGLSALAHPTTISDPEKMIAKLKSSGLTGLEVYYNGYAEDERNRLLRLAEKYDLIATGGSDYHGLDESNETMLGDAGVPQKVAEQLINRAQQVVLKPADL